jgi:hypothetical protein
MLFTYYIIIMLTSKLAYIYPLFHLPTTFALVANKAVHSLFFLKKPHLELLFSMDGFHMGSQSYVLQAK